MYHNLYDYLAHLLLAKTGAGQCYRSLWQISPGSFKQAKSAFRGGDRLSHNSSSQDRFLYRLSSDVASACHHLFRKYRHWSRVIIDIAFDYFFQNTGAHTVIFLSMILSGSPTAIYAIFLSGMPVRYQTIYSAAYKP
jgi:hypothetical protein